MDTGFAKAAGFTGQAVVIYRCCKRCEGVAGRRVALRVTFLVRHHRSAPDRFGYARITSSDYQTLAGEIFHRYLPHQLPAVPCSLCNRPMLGRRIEGRVNESVPCDVRCTSAVGHKCECSCGGKNHGADNAA